MFRRRWSTWSLSEAQFPSGLGVPHKPGRILCFIEGLCLEMASFGLFLRPRAGLDRLGMVRGCEVNG